MGKRSTSRRGAQAQRMAIKRQRARMLTEARVGAGEVVLCDKADVDFEHVHDLDARGVCCYSNG